MLHRIMAHTIAIVTLVTSIFGCSYNGKINPDFFRTTVNSSATKIPLKLAIIKTSDFSDKSFIQNAIDKNINITVQPYLANAVQTNMNNIFTKADIIKIEDMNNAEYDIIMFPKYSYISIDTNRFFKTYIMKQEIEYNFKNIKKNLEVASFKASDTIDYSPPAGAKVSGFLTGFTCFVLAPIFIPLETNIIGNHAVETLEVSLSNMLNSLNDQIYINRNAFR